MKHTKKLLITAALLTSGLSYGQVLTGCGDCNTNTTRPSYTQTVRPSGLIQSVYSSGKLDEMIRFVEALNGKVDYYTYGEVFLPIKLQIGSLKTVQAVYGSSHQQTLTATIKFLGEIDKNWETISSFKNTEMFFETINYFELIILQLKRDTYL